MSLISQLEALLYVSHKPLSLKRLAQLTGAEEGAIPQALHSLQEQLRQGGHGVMVVEQHGVYQMATVGEHAALISDFLKQEVMGEMTRPQIETLTIIAYRGPLSKGELEIIRGVNCSLILRNLMMRGLVEETDSSPRASDEGAAVPVMRRYQVTIDFLKHLGLGSVQELPEYGMLSHHDFIEHVLQKTKESDQ